MSEKRKNRKVLHIEISTHPYKETGWELRIGDIAGSVGIVTPNANKTEILDEIKEAMIKLEKEE